MPPFVLYELLCGDKSTLQVEAFCEGARIERIDKVPFQVYGVAAERFRGYLDRRRTAPNVVECPHCGSRNSPTCIACGDALQLRRLPTDHLIGAFAVCGGHRCVVTRDTGVYARDFRDLQLI